MKFPFPPTATPKISGDADTYISRQVIPKVEDQKLPSQPIVNFRGVDAFVLLGEPGSGKSTLFRHEAEALGESARYVTVRDFLRSALIAYDSRRVLFIDGMDEQRAADGVVNQPLDRLIEKLETLGKPKFRLSCRAADWHKLDTDELKKVARDGKIHALYLQSLTEDEILQVLSSWTPARLADPVKFIEKARENGLDSMLGNPLLLDLLVGAVSGDKWPASRTEIFEQACSRLVKEHNVAHERVAGTSNTAELLDDAGLLCLVLLLSDKERYHILGHGSDSVSVNDLAARLGIPLERAIRALNTNVFVAEDETRWYRHRLIAEFLAARAVVKILDAGLPIKRVLALMGGADGGIVDALRGLYGWMVSFSSQRDLLLQHDVLAVIYYGDVRHFDTEIKRLVFETIHRSAQLRPGIGRRDWQSKAFGALGTPDMATYFAEVLDRNKFEEADQVLLLSVLEAIEHGDPIMELLPAVTKVVRNKHHWGIVRQAAVDVLISKSQAQEPFMMSLLEEIRQGQVQDKDDELAGRLLESIYPSGLSTSDLVTQYLHLPKQGNFFGSYRNFWQRAVWSNVPDSEVLNLVNGICDMARTCKEPERDYFVNELYYGAILQAVEKVGDALTGEQIYQWISAGLHERGYRVRESSRTSELGRWLIANPEKLKAVFECGLVQRNSRGLRLDFWGWLHVLLPANQVPEGWYPWLLEVAGRQEAESIVRECFGAAAWAAANAVDRFPDGLDQIYMWQKKHGDKWPNVDAWREEHTSKSLDDWQRQEHSRQLEHAEQTAAEQVKRRDELAPHVDVILNGGVIPWLMHDIFLAMESKFIDIKDKTPLERVRNYLGCDVPTAERAIEALRHVLDRGELPNWQQVVEAFEKKEYFFLQPVCVHAGEMKWAGTDNFAELLLRDDVLALLAFSLVNGSKPKWFDALILAKPKQVVPVLKAFIGAAIRLNDHRVKVLDWLDSCPIESEVPKEIANFLLDELSAPFDGEFPKGPKGSALQTVIRFASSTVFEPWVNIVLAKGDLTPIVETAVVTASLAFSHARFAKLLTQVSTDPVRAVACCHVFRQPDPRVILTGLTIPQLGLLVEHLGRLVEPSGEAIYRVGNDDNIRSGVTALMAELAYRASHSATLEVVRLQQVPHMEPWRYKLEEYRLQCEKAVRDANFGIVGPLEVADVVRNREPANEQDLIAFVFDHLDALMRCIRFGGTNLLKMFWRVNQAGARVPLSENECRDHLLHLLNHQMQPMGVQIGKEQHTAREKRADMAINFTRPGRHMSVPVEVKLDSHPEVWLAWDSQLMGLYAPDPTSGYHGVYLVLFTGRKTKLPPSRKRPSTAEEMAQVFSGLIKTSYKGRLHGLVLDLSWI